MAGNDASGQPPRQQAVTAKARSCRLVGGRRIEPSPLQQRQSRLSESDHRRPPPPVAVPVLGPHPGRQGLIPKVDAVLRKGFQPLWLGGLFLIWLRNSVNSKQFSPRNCTSISPSCRGLPRPRSRHGGPLSDPAQVQSHMDLQCPLLRYRASLSMIVLLPRLSLMPKVKDEH